MEGLTTDNLLMLMIFGLIGAFSVLSLMIGVREVNQIRRRWDGRNVEADEALIFEFVADGNPQTLSRVKRSETLRDRLVRLASQLEGEANGQVSIAYTALGFTYDDFKILHGRSLPKMTQAIQRCRSLHISLPPELWDTLLAHKNRSMRWAAMEYMILIRQKLCLYRFQTFMRQPNNQNRGMALHLACCFAKVAPTMIAALLEHDENEFLRETWLHTLSLYPVPAAEGLLFDIVSTLDQGRLLPVAIQAVGASPSAMALPVLVGFATHPDGQIRTHVAEALASYSEQASIDALAMLAIDTNFDVRAQAVDSLVAVGPEAAAEIALIDESPDHPSHLLLQRAVVGQF